MRLSNYAYWIEVMDDIYALFNSILMQIVFVNGEQLSKIKSFDVEESEKNN